MAPLDGTSAPPVAVARLEAFVFRYPLETPVVTSFGRMADRPAVLVRVEDGEGAAGWGEIWCNFPGVGAEHRARLVTSEIAPRLVQAPAAAPEAQTRRLEAGLRVLALQTGEWGPLAQCLAGVDIALWDLAARRAGLPLAMLLRPDAPRAVPLYASGIAAAVAEAMIPGLRAAGNTAFKVKVGFDRARDLAVLRALAAGLGPGERLMADANQAWDREAACAFAAETATLGLDWLEEPLAADRPLGEWGAVAEASRAPSSPTPASGAASRAACRWAARPVMPACATARISSVPASASLPRRICSRRSGARGCSRSTSTPTRCARRWPRPSPPSRATAFPSPQHRASGSSRTSRPPRAGAWRDPEGRAPRRAQPAARRSRAASAKTRSPRSGR
jgi:hypothetical protein